MQSVDLLYLKVVETMINNKIVSSVINLLFPPRCITCGVGITSKDQLCLECKDLIPFIESPICNSCGAVFHASAGTNHLCGKCMEKRPSYQQVLAFTLYEEPIITILHRLKYVGDTSGLAVVRYCIHKSPIQLFDDIDVVIPVPLHLKRLRERGFNQALLLGREMFYERSTIIQSDILQRVRNTASQTFLSRKERQGNLRKAFVVEHQERVRGRRICLVDDVFTTGATIEECSKTLIKAGASEVVVLVFARVANK